MNVKALLLMCFTALFVVTNAMANDANLFSYDKTSVTSQMSSLTTVENYVNANEGVTLSELQSSNSDVLEGVNLNSSAFAFSSMAEGPLGIPSFLWGCVLGAIGILIVYLITQDSEETKKALWGCLAGAGAWLLFWVIWVVILGSTAV